MMASALAAWPEAIAALSRCSISNSAPVRARHSPRNLSAAAAMLGSSTTSSRIFCPSKGLALAAGVGVLPGQPTSESASRISRECDRDIKEAMARIVGCDTASGTITLDDSPVLKESELAEGAPVWQGRRRQGRGRLPNVLSD